MAEKDVMAAYHRLTLAIIEQACLDYADVAERMYFHDDLTLLKRQKVTLNEIKQFFHSEWFEMMSDLDGDELLRGAQAMARKNITARLKRECSDGVNSMMRITSMKGAV